MLIISRFEEIPHRVRNGSVVILLIPFSEFPKALFAILFLFQGADSLYSFYFSGARRLTTRPHDSVSSKDISRIHFRPYIIEN